MYKRVDLLKKISQQLPLFEEEGEELRLEQDTALKEVSDTFDLDIDWAGLAIPDEEIEMRLAIANLLLKENPSRSQQDVADEILRIRTNNLFENDIKPYIRRFPELSAKDPDDLDENQLLLPGAEPDIRFMPKIKDLDAQKSQAERDNALGRERLEELRLIWNETAEEKNRFQIGSIDEYGAQSKLEKLNEENEGSTPLPKTLRESDMERIMKADLTLSQAEYKRLEGKLREKYLTVRSKEDELRELIAAVSSSIPPEPSSANIEEMEKIEDFVEDFRKRVIFLSHHVIANSAKWTMFGVTRPDNVKNYRQNDDALFLEEDEGFIDDPNALLDYMQKTPTLLGSLYQLGWAAIPSPERYFDIKNKRLTAYEESIDSAIKSLSKGARFLKRLDKMLQKELEERKLINRQDSSILFVERELIEELRAIYKNIVAALYGDLEVSQKSYYYDSRNNKFHGAPKLDRARDEQSEREGLSLFDINEIFHNKIKFYEVVEKFGDMINLLTRRPLQRFGEEFYNPIIQTIGEDISKRFVSEIFKEEEPILKEFYKDWRLIQETIDNSKSSYRGSSKKKAWDELRESGPAKIENLSAKAQLLVDRWIEISGEYGGQDLRSVLVYPKFIARNKNTVSSIQSSLRLKMVLSIVESLFNKARLPNLEYTVVNTIKDMVQSGQIRFEEYEKEGLDPYQRVSLSLTNAANNNISDIKKTVFKRLFAQPLITGKSFVDLSSHANRFIYSHFGSDENFNNIAKIIGSTGDPKHASTVYDLNLEESAETRIQGIISGDIDKSKDEAVEISLMFNKAVQNFQWKYIEGLRQIVELMDGWNLTDENTTDIARKYFGEDIIPEEYIGRLTAPSRIASGFWKKFKGSLDEKQLSSLSEISDKYYSDMAISNRTFYSGSITQNPSKFLEAFPSVPVMSPEVFRKMLQELALTENGAASIEHRVDENYIELIEAINSLNALVNVYRENLIPAKDQLEALAGIAVYRRMFSGRLNAFKTVGPRKINKTIKSSRGSKSKNFALTLFKGWINDSRDSADETIEEVVHNPLFFKMNRHFFHIKDPIQEFWSNGGVQGNEIKRDKAGTVTYLIREKLKLDNPQEVRRVYNVCSKFLEKHRNRNYGNSEFKLFVPIIFKDTANLESDLKTLVKISDFAHNTAANMPMSFYKKILNDVNFKNFGTNATVEKYFEMCTNLARMGGLAKIRRDYKGQIEMLRQTGMLPPGSIKTLREAYRTCREGIKISPNLEGLSEEERFFQTNLRQTLEVVDTTLTAIKESSALSRFNERVRPKDPALFNLNWEVPSKGFRFRVLKTFDPYHFRVGAETGCCQRLGGLGEPAAVDSYINPLAGVLVLEVKDESSWELASQSYFHYVPETNSYILDNVEHNRNVARKIYLKGLPSLEMLYAMLAAYAKKVYNVENFLSGSGYSKINADDFGKKRMDRDPRSFSVSKKYTDWSSRGSIDLLTPNFVVPDISDLVPKKTRGVKRSLAIDSSIPIRLKALSLWLNSQNMIKESAFITNLKDDVSESMAEQMEALEDKYFSRGYAQDHEDILDDMRQPGASGVVYTGDDEDVRGYLYGFELDAEDQFGIPDDYDEEDIRALSNSMECYSEDCLLDSYTFLKKMAEIAIDKKIFYVSNFLVDKPHRVIVPKLISMLVEEVRSRGYKYMAFNALSATHRLIVKDGKPIKEREEKFGIKALCKIDMYAPMFIVELS